MGVELCRFLREYFGTVRKRRGAIMLKAVILIGGPLKGLCQSFNCKVIEIEKCRIVKLDVKITCNYMSYTNYKYIIYVIIYLYYISFFF